MRRARLVSTEATTTRAVGVIVGLSLLAGLGAFAWTTNEAPVLEAAGPNELIPAVSIDRSPAMPEVDQRILADTLNHAEVMPRLEAARAAELARQRAADAARRKAAAEAAARAARSRPRPARTGGGAGGALAAIRACESGGNYSAVSSSGKYRGAYQFDRQTWASVGGSGDPAAASPEEQDARAARLMAERGRSPWPNC